MNFNFKATERGRISVCASKIKLDESFLFPTRALPPIQAFYSRSLFRTSSIRNIVRNGGAFWCAFVKPQAAFNYAEVTGRRASRERAVTSLPVAVFSLRNLINRISGLAACQKSLIGLCVAVIPRPSFVRLRIVVRISRQIADTRTRHRPPGLFRLKRYR